MQRKKRGYPRILHPARHRRQMFARPTRRRRRVIALTVAFAWVVVMFWVAHVDPAQPRATDDGAVRLLALVAALPVTVAAGFYVARTRAVVLAVAPLGAAATLAMTNHMPLFRDRVEPLIAGTWAASVAIAAVLGFILRTAIDGSVRQ